MQIKKGFSKFAEKMEADNYSTETIKIRRDAVRRFEEYLEKVEVDACTGSINEEIIRSFFIYLARVSNRGRKNKKKLSKNTIKLVSSSLREFFNYLFNSEIIIKDLGASVPMIEAGCFLPDNILSKEDIERVCSLVKTNRLAGYRDRLVIELIYNTGMRIGEVLNLKISDIDLKEEIIHVKKGKGRKGRICPLTGVLKEFIIEYLEHIRPFLVSERDENYLVLTIQGKSPKKVTLQHRISSYGKKSGLNKPVHPHAFRHAFSVHMLQKGCDIKYINRLLGHSRLSTTEVYTKIEKRDLREKLLEYHFFRKEEEEKS